jgi:hypothetical protein
MKQIHVPHFVCLAVFLGCTSCAPQPSGPSLDMETLRLLDPYSTRAIEFEERGGNILVTVVDKYGDAHVHHLVLGEGESRTQALELLRRKQDELGG